MKKISFPVRAGFRQRLNQRVSEYFDRRGVARTGDWRMFLKTGIILSWLATSYILLVFFASSPAVGILAALAVAAGIVLVGFNLMHDGAHGSYSANKTINRVAAWTLDLIGGSQMLWRQKHNILHHTYTNIAGADDDLDTSGLLRLSPDQSWHSWHRFQHLYAPALYSLLTINWVFYTDFRKFFTGRIGEYRLKQPSLRESLSFFSAKGLYFGYALVVPLMVHDLLVTLAFFILIHLIGGFIFSVVFQLAHTVDGNEFPAADPRTGSMKSEWSIHEVETTANFAMRNKFLSWLCGGLNFQIEHHLLPKVCHIHYPALSSCVRQTCTEFQVRYTHYPTVRSALMMHFRFLRELGKPPVPEFAESES